VFTPGSKFLKNSLFKPESVLHEGETALAMFQIGLNNKVLTDKRVLFLDALDSKVKEFIDLEKVEEFVFGSSMGSPRVDALMKDGSTVKMGTLDSKWVEAAGRLFTAALVGSGMLVLDELTGAQEQDPRRQESSGEDIQIRTNSQKAFPKWLIESIHSHKSEAEDVLMVITEPYVNHQGALIVFEDRCMIVKGGFWGGLMAGSFGGERAGTFYFTQITGIEYNSGMITGVLEILTASYQGSANKDYWRGSTKSRNADSNDPWTLSNCLPLSKDGYKSAQALITELKSMISRAQRPVVNQGLTQSSDLASELKKLAELRDQGILSDEEFSSAKAKLING
jgi:hypothetical protein